MLKLQNYWRTNNDNQQKICSIIGYGSTGKKLESWATDEDKKIYQEMKHADKVMRESAKKLGIKNPIMEIPLEVEF